VTGELKTIAGHFIHKKAAFHHFMSFFSHTNVLIKDCVLYQSYEYKHLKKMMTLMKLDNLVVSNYYEKPWC
jgi:hypothetical protein